MKLIHISDIHIHPAPILGIDPVANFKACLDHIAGFDADADRIVITGDLTHHGRLESYQQLKEILAWSPLQGDLEPRLLIGNHDDRDTFRSVFPEARCDDNGYIQWTEDVAAGRFVYLDTVEKGTHAGHLGRDRLAWLRRELMRAVDDGVAAWLFLHHNPTAVHVANADAIGLIDEGEFLTLLLQFRPVVRHIFFGHCHFTLSGAIHGIPFSAPRSTCHTCWPDFSGDAGRMGYGDLVPNYNVCILTEHSAVVHSIDFLDAQKVKWLEN